MRLKDSFSPPLPRDADGVPVFGHADDRSKYSGRAILGRPNPTTWNKRRKPDLFASRRAVVAKIQPRMNHQDRKAAADQKHHEKEIEKMTISNPKGKSILSGQCSSTGRCACRRCCVSGTQHRRRLVALGRRAQAPERRQNL